MSGNVKASITTTYSSGTNWYRVYSDGWIEQGGLSSAVTDTTTKITLHKSFKDTNYCVYTAITNCSKNHPHLIVETKTSTALTLRMFSAEGTYSFQGYWYACGY